MVAIIVYDAMMFYISSSVNYDFIKKKKQKQKLYKNTQQKSHAKYVLDSLVQI